MSTVEKVSVALSPDLLDMVKGAVASGQYGSASEVIREALREWRLRQPLREAEAELEKKITGWDEDAKYAAAARTRQRTASQTFAVARQAQCALAASLAGGAAGNASEIARGACVYELNSLRAAQLKETAEKLSQRVK